MDAPATLGKGVRVTQGALMEHFLLTWARWTRLDRRYPQYFGLITEGDGGPISRAVGTPMLFPRQSDRWPSFPVRCRDLADEAFRADFVTEWLVEAWRSKMPVAPAESDDIEQWFGAFAELHARRELMRLFALMDLPVEVDGAGLFEPQESRLVEQLQRTQMHVQAAVRRHLRFLRHSTLDASWLSNQWPPSVASSLGAADAEDWPKRAMTQLSSRGRTVADASRLLTRVQAAVWEGGFGRLAEDLHSPEFRPSLSGPLGVAGVELNPDPATPRVAAGGPASIVVVVARPGGRGWRGIDPGLHQLAGALDRGDVSPGMVVVLTDAWDSAAFNRDHRFALASHAARGVGFLVLLADATDQRLTLVDAGL